MGSSQPPEWNEKLAAILAISQKMNSERDLGALLDLIAREATDVLILPEVDNIEIRNWKGFEPAVEAGYRAANEVLDKLTHPVIDLRRRAALADKPRRPIPAAISAGG